MAAIDELLRRGLEQRATGAAAVMLWQDIDRVDLAAERVVGRPRASADAETDDCPVVLGDEHELMRRQRGHLRAATRRVIAQSVEQAFRHEAAVRVAPGVGANAL